MKATIFYVYISLLLLCGGYTLYSAAHLGHENHLATAHATKRPHTQIMNADWGSTVMDDSDFDLDEDDLNNPDENDRAKLVIGKEHFTPSWYLAFFEPLVADQCRKPFKIIPYTSGNTSPIYISQRVLRI